MAAFIFYLFIVYFVLELVWLKVKISHDQKIIVDSYTLAQGDELVREIKFCKWIIYETKVVCKEYVNDIGGSFIRFTSCYKIKRPTWNT